MFIMVRIVVSCHWPVRIERLIVIGETLLLGLIPLVFSFLEHGFFQFEFYRNDITVPYNIYKILYTYTNNYRETI